MARPPPCALLRDGAGVVRRALRRRDVHRAARSLRLRRRRVEVRLERIRLRVPPARRAADDRRTIAVLDLDRAAVLKAAAANEQVRPVDLHNALVAVLRVQPRVDGRQQHYVLPRKPDTLHEPRQQQRGA